MSQVCTRCGERDALRPNMFIGSKHGAFCSQCAVELIRDLTARAGGPPLPPGLTPEQMLDVGQRFWAAAEEAGPDADPEVLRNDH